MQKYKNIYEVMEARHSVRNYENRRLSDSDREKVLELTRQCTNPFGVDVSIHYLEKDASGQQEKLGTYGTIKGASSFLGLSVLPGENALLAAGYQFEQLVLDLTAEGFGTVWLAGTFSRGPFAKSMGITDRELFPAISPVGYPAKKKHLMESLMRAGLKANHRKPWKELFFDGSWEKPLTEEAAGKYRKALEMLRIAPSATNSQPWRVIKDGETFHFFETHKAGSGEEIQKIKQVDLGIAMCHFDLATKEVGLCGRFVKQETLPVTVPEHTTYLMSWIAEA